MSSRETNPGNSRFSQDRAFCILSKLHEIAHSGFYQKCVVHGGVNSVVISILHASNRFLDLRNADPARRPSIPEAFSFCTLSRVRMGFQHLLRRLPAVMQSGGGLRDPRAVLVKYNHHCQIIDFYL